MNCGLSNLDALKRELLPSGLRSGRTFDETIIALGQGMAGIFDTETNRLLARQVDATASWSADRDHVYVPRYPIESVSRVEVSEDGSTWETVSGEPVLWDATTGLVRFGGTVGGYDERVRVTWTGGYWFSTVEPDEEGYPETAPDGATALPAALRYAFFVACRAAWQALDKTGADVLRTGSSSQFVTGSLSGLELPPLVRVTLQAYRRYVLS
jgi:hypothetical protein